ncbi:MAG: prolyl oligopeptidase family serine peptidase [Ilumatobacteraceae bacterium]
MTGRPFDFEAESPSLVDLERPPSHAEATKSFPRESARTQRYTLGEPRDVIVSPDGRRIVFLRSRAGTDPVNCLWVVDARSGEERLVADPALLLADRLDAPGADELPPEERLRRERTREAAGGITSFATDDAVTVAAFALAGRLFVAGLISATSRELDVAGPVFDPRPDPLARRVAYVSGRLLCLAELDGRWHVLRGGDTNEPDTVSWGSADFIAAEEIHRFRGFWWSPDGGALAVARVDTAPVGRWWVSDPADPAAAPTEIAYPAAGTGNAEVSLHIVRLDGTSVLVQWDRSVHPYLVDVHWSEHGLLVTLQRRDQTEVVVLDVDETTGATTERWRDRDGAWVELVPGVPRLGPGGELVTCADRDGTRRLLVDGAVVTPIDLQVRTVVAVDGPGIVVLANPVDDATVLHVWRYLDGTLEALTDEPGVHAVAVGGGTVAIRTTTLHEPRVQWATLDGVELVSFATVPRLQTRPTLSRSGARRLATAVLLPNDHDGSPLPVLVDPYGGPHALRVVQAHHAHLTSQWFADQGFAVVVTDGRGTPGRGAMWERAVHHDLVTAVLADQLKALQAAAEQHEELDLDRVAIRGWSFGGFLAALAVLRRPDVFHAAIAGAPVTEWRLYDTHYTERYLGDPRVRPDVYDANSLLPLAAGLTRPLLLVHGLADDNVVAAHTLQLSSALLAAGAPHEVLPLVGITHLAASEVVAENLLLHQLDFLRRSLPPAPSQTASTTVPE